LVQIGSGAPSAAEADFMIGTEQVAERKPTGTIASVAKIALASGLVLIAAIALAACVQAIESPLQNRPEKAVLAAGVLFAAVLVILPGLYMWRMGRRILPETASLAFLAACSLVMLATYFFWIREYVFFPADILIWSEGDFVNDILKLSLGYPLYTAPSNADSFHYVPGAQVLTWLLASLAGKGDSIPAYRVVQMVFTAAAAYVATLCCRRIVRLTNPASKAAANWLWFAFWYASFFLMATNSITNGFAHNLHGDALAQLANIAAFYLLLRYIEKPGWGVLAAMIALGPIGFLIKQNLLVWPVFFAVFLAIWGRSRTRLVVFSIAGAAACLATIGLCFAIWGQPFGYWVFYEMSTHPVSVLRSLQHALDSWAYFAAGLLGGIALLRGKPSGGLFGVWLIWLALIALETYTSGIEWLLNHLGPGSLMAGVWFLAALAALWDRMPESTRAREPEDWVFAGAMTAVVLFTFSGMGLVRIPLRPLSPDAWRYVHDIESQFQGWPADRILLDTGTWVYRKDRVIMKDRATSISTQAAGNVEVDFSAFLSRLAAKRYSKILVRDFHRPNCWYDNALWPRARGLRNAILDNYRETGSIRAAVPPNDVKQRAEDPQLFSEITILEPTTGTVQQGIQ
jgi:hypothetical protein